MLGWTLLFSLITATSALSAAFSHDSICWAARSAGTVFGSLVVLCLGCVIAGNAVRDSLR